MIGNKKTPMGMDTPNTDAVNRIVEGTTFEGNIRSMSNMRVDGTFQGDIVTKGRLVVGPKGIIKGNVSCANCDVEGSMEGTIEVAELMSMKRSAKVAGTIFYGQLSVEAVHSQWARSTWVPRGEERSTHDGQAGRREHPQGCRGRDQHAQDEGACEGPHRYQV